MSKTMRKVDMPFWRLSITFMTKRVVGFSPYRLAGLASAIGVVMLFNALLLHAPWVGIPLTIIYLVFGGRLTGMLLEKITNIRPELRTLFGLLLFHYFLSFFGALFVVLLRLTLAIEYAIALLLPLLIALLIPRLPEVHSAPPLIYNNVGEHKAYVPVWIISTCILLFVVLFWMLFSARTGAYILSPWDVMPSVFFIFVFLLAFLVFWLTFSSRRWQLSLIFIVAFSFLVHSHLTIIYKAGYGGDKWRHLGTERQIKRGEPLQPSLLDHPITMQKIGPIAVPTVLVSGNKTSYANQWAATILYADFLQVDVFRVDYVLVFILWSLFIPLLFFQLGLFVLQGKVLGGLIFAASSTLFYVLLVDGSFTVPVSYGHILWLFALVGIVGLRSLRRHQIVMVLFVLTVIMYFNYILTFFLWIAMLFGYLLFQVANHLWNNKTQIRNILLTFVFVLFVTLGIPALDILYSHLFGLGVTIARDKFTLHTILHSFTQWIQATTGLLGLTESGHFVTTSIFFGLQNLAYPFNAPFALLLANSMIMLLVILGFLAIWKRKDAYSSIIALLCISLFIILYINSTFLNSGPRPLSNRVDLPLFLLLVPVVGISIHHMVNIAGNRRSIITLLSFFMALVFIFSYITNPVERNVSPSEVRAMEHLFTVMQKFGLQRNSCVIADPWLLLALQAVSDNRVIGGGFPIEQEFSQPLLTRLRSEMQRYPQREIADEAMQRVGADRCYFVTEDRWLADYWQADYSKPFREELFHLTPYEKIDDVYIFTFTAKNVMP